jgi:hypothetical protein
LDHTGKHLIVSLCSRDHFYVNVNFFRPKVLSKFKGHIVESVAFNNNNNSSSGTQEIFIATSEGLLYETELECTTSSFLPGRPEKYFKQVYQFDQKEPIVGYFCTNSSERRCILLAITQTRLYQFSGTLTQGTPRSSAMFSKYKTSQALVFQELLSDSPTSALAVYNTFDNISPSFAWMNGLGIYYGTLSIDERQKSDFLLRNTILFLFTSENNFNAAPLSFIPTKLHFLILGGTYLAGICTLNQSVVFRRGLSTISSSRLIGLCADHERGTYWCYSADSVYEICASNEEEYCPIMPLALICLRSDYLPQFSVALLFS